MPRSTGEILRIFGEHWRIVVIGAVMTILNTTMFYFVNGYTSTYGTSVLHLAPVGNFTVAFAVATASFVCCPSPARFPTGSAAGRW